jgi:mRNA interferase RelE/StbE
MPYCASCHIDCQPNWQIVNVVKCPTMSEPYLSEPYKSLDITDTFRETFASFEKRDRNRFLKALRFLDENEKHPSLRVHELEGDLAGTWSASASDVLRMTFERTTGGRKTMLTCSRHYR